MTKQQWQPLDLSTLPNCRYIACDPSLSATGLVAMEVHDGEVYVFGAVKIGTEKTDKVGWEDTFLRSQQLKEKMRPIIGELAELYGNTFIQGVNEAPPVGNGMMRTESSILAGYVFREVCAEQGIDSAALVTAHAHKALLCGNGKASKKEHGEAVKRLLPDIFDGKLISNEALRDALSIGLYAAHRLGK